MRIPNIVPFLWLGLNQILLQPLSVSAVPVPHPVNDRITIGDKDIDAAIESAKNLDEWMEVTSNLRKPWDPTRWLKAVHMYERQLPVILEMSEKYVNPPDDTHKRAWPKKPLLPSVDEFVADQHAFRRPYSLAVKYSNIMEDEAHELFYYLPRIPDHREPWTEESLLEPGLSKYREMMSKRKELDALTDDAGDFWLDTSSTSVEDLNKYLAPETFEKELQDVINKGKTVEWERKLGIEGRMLDLLRARWSKVKEIEVASAEYASYTARSAIHEKRLGEWKKYMNKNAKQ